MTPNSDFEELLRTFKSCDVNAEHRYAKDLDIWIEVSNENAEKVFRALAAFGAPSLE